MGDDGSSAIASRALVRYRASRWSFSSGHVCSGRLTRQGLPESVAQCASAGGRTRYRHAHRLARPLSDAPPSSGRGDGPSGLTPLARLCVASAFRELPIAALQLRGARRGTWGHDRADSDVYADASTTSPMTRCAESPTARPDRDHPLPHYILGGGALRKRQRRTSRRQSMLSAPTSITFTTSQSHSITSASAQISMDGSSQL